MKWILVVIAVVVAVVVVVTAIGALLPVAHHATVARSIPALPDTVWALITDVEAQPSWRDEVDAVERLPDRDGRRVWREVSRFGAMTMEATEWEPPRRLVTRIADEDLPYGGTWTWELEPAGEGATRVTVTEDGEIYSAFFRFVARFFMGYDGTMNRYLDGLEARVQAAS